MEASLETVQMPDGGISCADSPAPNTRVGRLLRERERKKGGGNGNGEPENPGNGSAETPNEEHSSDASALAVNQERKTTDAMNAKQRLLVVANRLPVRAVRTDGGDWALEETSGGLVSALVGVGVTEFDAQWIGWPGLSVAESDEVGRQTLTQALAEENCIPVFLDEKTIEDYYNGYCNVVLWPLFHYLGLPKEDRLATTHTLQSQFEAYQKANKLFAEVVNAHYKEDDIIWCHDYHLMFLPKYLKEHNSGMKVGWFLHTPFPSSEIHRILPSRSEVLHAVLAADLIGFQTYDYARHFLSACTCILGLEGTPSGVEGQGKLTRVAAFPIGITPQRFIGTLEDPEVQDHIKELKKKIGERKVIVGVDRLDTIKGIPQKILAFEKFLEEKPEWCEKVVLVQIAVPSRTEVHEYQQLRSQVHELVGRINGRFGTFSSVPIHHLDRNLALHELCALYSFTDIALITSLRDGMNLVSYEFVACQNSKKGVLILSEFSGAAQSLGAGAILVNPWNITEIASAIGQALNMPAEEREKRHRVNFEHVMTHTAQQWAELFISELNDTLIEAQQRIGTVPPPLVVNDCIQGFLQSKNRLLILGFNAVLTELTDTHGRRDQIKEMEFKLHPDVKEPLRILCDDPNTTVLVLSGSGRTVLDNNFREYNMWLAAENGMFVRSTNGDWMTAMPDHMIIDWIDNVKDVFDYFTERTPRSRCDVRETSVVWNYKYSDIEFGKLQAKDMLAHLWDGPISNKSVDIILGSRSVEVRPCGITKGLSIQCILAEILQSKPVSTPFDYVLCLGHFLGKDEDIYRFFDPDPPLATPMSPSKPKATDTMKHICEREPSGKDEDKSPGSSASKCSSLKHTPDIHLLDLKKEKYFLCAVGRSRTNARYLLNSSDDAVALLKEMAAACSSQNDFTFPTTK